MERSWIFESIRSLRPTYLEGTTMKNKKPFEFTDANFELEVLQSESPVLVDFWAAWCGPCRAVGPSIDQLAGEYAESAKVGKLNIDENPEAARQFGITSIPAVLLFKDGELVETFVGVRPRERYAQALDQVLSTA
jgi:thioredoxin 1